VLRLHRLTRPRQPAFAAGHQARYPAGYAEPAGRRTSHMVPFSRCLSAAGVRFLGARFPPKGVRLSSRSAYHPTQRVRWTLTGFPRSTRVRHGRVGCPLYPGGDGVPATVEESSVAVCRLSAAGLLSPRRYNPTRGVAVTRHLRGFTGIHPFSLPLTRGPRTEREPFGFSLSSVPGHCWPRTSGRGPVTDTDRELRLRHQPTLQST
jgi:hypothetical protein